MRAVCLAFRFDSYRRNARITWRNSHFAFQPRRDTYRTHAYARKMPQPRTNESKARQVVAWQPKYVAYLCERAGTRNCCSKIRQIVARL